MIGFLIGLLTVLVVINAVLLIGIILIQQSKVGGGLGAMGGGMTESVFGTGAGNILTKGTVILASIFLVVTLMLAILTGHRNRASSIVDAASDASSVKADVTATPVEPATPAAPAAATPATPAPAPATTPAAPPAAPAKPDAGR